MNIKALDIAKQSVFENREEFHDFLDWVESLDGIRIKAIPREFYDSKYNEGGDILERDTDRDSKAPAYTLYVPYGITYADVLYLVDLVTQKLGVKEYFTNNWLAASVKTQLVHALGKNTTISQEEIIELQKVYHLSDETITRITNAPITLSALRRIYQDQSSIDSLKNTIKIGLDSLFVDRGKQTLGDFMMTFTKDDYDKLPEETKKTAQVKYFGGNDEIVKQYLDEVEQNLGGKIEQHYKSLESVGEEDKNEEIVRMIGREIGKFPRSLTNMHSLKQILQNKETQCLMQCFLAHVFLSRLGIKHTSFITYGHIQLIVYVGQKKLLLDSTSYLPVLPILEKSKSKELPYATRVSVGFSEFVGYEQEPNIGLLSTLYINKNSVTNSVKYYDYAIALNPHNRWGYVNRFNYYYRNGDADKAEKDLANYMELTNIAYEKEKDVKSYANTKDMHKALFIMYSEKHDIQKMEQIYQKILAIGENDEDITTLQEMIRIEKESMKV